eukprot:scaffold85848_cov30-Tisochrysis_lutea.AAC.2
MSAGQSGREGGGEVDGSYRVAVENDALGVLLGAVKESYGSKVTCVLSSACGQPLTEASLVLGRLVAPEEVELLP